MANDDKKVKEVIDKIRKNIEKLKKNTNKNIERISEIERNLKIENDIIKNPVSTDAEILNKPFQKLNEDSYVFIDDLNNPKIIYIADTNIDSDANYFLYLDKNLNIKFQHPSYKKYLGERRDAEFLKTLFDKVDYNINLHFENNVNDSKLSQGLLNYMLKNNIKNFEDIDIYKYFDYLSKNYVDENKMLSDKIEDEIKKQNFAAAIGYRVIIVKDGKIDIINDQNINRKKNKIGKIKNNYDLYKIAENSYKEILMEKFSLYRVLYYNC